MWLDVIIGLLIVGFIVSRFTKFKLPRDQRPPQQRQNDWGRLRDAATRAADAAAVAARPRTAKPKPVAAGVARDLTGMDKLLAMEPDFNETQFLEGARGAYAYYHQAYAQRDEQALENLCSPALLGRLVNHWDAPGHEIGGEVEHIDAATIGNVVVKGKTAMIEVVFKAVHRQTDGTTRPMTSRWTLARPLGSDDPNWLLENIQHEVDA